MSASESALCDHRCWLYRLSTALELAGNAGGDGIVVIDSMPIGEGALGRNGGQVIPGLKLDPNQLLERFGVDQGAALIQAPGGAADNGLGDSGGPDAALVR